MKLSLPTSQTSLESRALGCMAGLAVGNVLGLAIESCSRQGAQARIGSGGFLGRLPVEEIHREWDDDLAMAMALSEALMNQPHQATHLDTRAIQAAYFAWLRTGARGIGGLTREVLTKASAGEARAAERVWESRCNRGHRPLGNGAAMRIAPLGLAYAEYPARIASLAAEDAAITHWDPACRQTAGAIALLAAAMVRGERDPISFGLTHSGSLEAEVAEAWEPMSLDVLAERGLDGSDMGSTLLSLKVAVSIIHAGVSFSDALPWVLRQGGDTDTNGAIVGALLGARDGMTAIPLEWRQCVPQGDRILSMGWKLLRWSGLASPQVTH